MSGVYHQSGRFVHYHEVFILVDYIKWDIFGNDFVFITRTIHHDGDDIHRFHLVAALDRFVVSHYKTGFR